MVLSLVLAVGCTRRAEEPSAEAPVAVETPSFSAQVQAVRDGVSRRIEVAELLSGAEWDALEGLAGLLGNSDWRVRLEGVRSLGLLGDASSVVHLIRALQDEDSRVSGEARGILRMILERLTHPSFCC